MQLLRDVIIIVAPQTTRRYKKKLVNVFSTYTLSRRRAVSRILNVLFVQRKQDTEPKEKSHTQMMCVYTGEARVEGGVPDDLVRARNNERTRVNPKVPQSAMSSAHWMDVTRNKVEMSECVWLFYAVKPLKLWRLHTNLCAIRSIYKAITILAPHVVVWMRAGSKCMFKHLIYEQCIDNMICAKSTKT